MIPSSSAMWQQPLPQPEAMPEEVTVQGGDLRDQIQNSDGSIEIKLPDGGVIIDLNPYLNRNRSDKPSKHDDNLAEKISDADLGLIASELIEGIEADDVSREDYLATLKTGLELIGLKLEDPRSDVANSSAPLEGMSTVKHPLLLEACLRYAANARGELLPAEGPAKVVCQGDETFQSMLQADALEEDFNHYLTTIASEYYPDTDKMLFLQGFQGSMFKKVYRCPIRQRPVSESVHPKDVIVNNTATDILNAARLTHVVPMRPSVMKRMKYLGVYRDVSVTQPETAPNMVDKAEARIEGVKATPSRQQDQEHTIWECYCELDLPGFEHKDKSRETGLPLPYKVTIDKDSREILEIRRNWEEDDELFLPTTPFVHYCYVPGFGFYGMGLLHILGNTNRALSAAWRMALDAFMFANFPGFLYRKNGATRQSQNNFRVAPGSGAAIEGSDDLRKDIMPLPYKEPSPVMQSFIDGIANNGQRLGGTAEANVGEGKQDAPVGTTLALIEQSSKIESAVHKRAHASQAREFQLLMKLFRADPESLWRKSNKAKPWDENVIRAALDNHDLIPQADPNTPSHMHRMCKVAFLQQLSDANPGVFDRHKLIERQCAMAKIDDAASLFAPPQQPQADPKLLAIKSNEQLEDKKIQSAQLINASKLQNDKAERDNKTNLEVFKLAREFAVHPEATGVASNTLHMLQPGS